MSRVCIVIPARFASTRLPGKLLKTIDGRSILHHVYTNCLQSKLVTKIIVATDHKAIFDHCVESHMDVIMTSDHHQSGTDRVAEAINLLQSSFDYIINVQGDEPMIQAKEINTLVSLISAKNADIATLYKVQKSAEKNDPNKVKLVQASDKSVLYFSRSSIPANRDGQEVAHKHHIGIYAFKPNVLQACSELLPSELEKAEKLEQLRWLENGYNIYASEVDYNGFGIDTEADLERARKLMSSL